jgi:predicted transcriptional regulator
MRSTAHSLQHQASETMKQIDPQHNEHLQLIRSLLAEDRTIMITRLNHAGRCIAIMDRSDCVRNMENI